MPTIKAIVTSEYAREGISAKKRLRYDANSAAVSPMRSAIR